MSSAGRLQLSICVVSAAQMKLRPELPIHVYDLDIDMWQSSANDQQGFSIEGEGVP